MTYFKLQVCHYQKGEIFSFEKYFNGDKIEVKKTWIIENMLCVWQDNVAWVSQVMKSIHTSRMIHPIEVAQVEDASSRMKGVVESS